MEFPPSAHKLNLVRRWLFVNTRICVIVPLSDCYEGAVNTRIRVYGINFRKLLFRVIPLCHRRARILPAIWLGENNELNRRAR